MTANGQPFILIAEDIENDVLMLRRAFLQAGLNVALQVVPNGEECINYLAGKGQYANRQEFPLPDLLLLDLKMPGVNGFEVLKWIRAQPSLASLRVVVLTTSERIRDINQAYTLGANSFLTKPLDFTDFRNTIDAIYKFWIERSKQPQVERPPVQNPLLPRKE